MKALVYSYAGRLQLGVLDRRLPQALLNFSDSVVVWAEGDTSSPTITNVLAGKVAEVAKRFPLLYNPDVIFFVTHSSSHTLFNLDWVNKPLIVFWADRWKGSWDLVVDFLQAVMRLDKLGGNIHYWAASKGGQSEIKEVTGKDALLIEGRVPDEVFLFPEEGLMNPPKRDIILWIGNQLEKRTIPQVWEALLKAFPDHFLVCVDPTLDKPPIQDRRVILFKGLNYLKLLRLIAQSKVVVAPYKRDIPYARKSNPIKYWEAVALNVPCVISNIEFSNVGCYRGVFDDDRTAVEFIVETTRKVLSGEIPPPFLDPETLHRFRVENWFSLQVARALKEVVECSQLSQFLDTALR